MVISLAVIGCFLSIYITKTKIDNRVSYYYSKENTCFYYKEHYQCEYDKKEIKKVMKLIPKDANLSSLNVFAAHLSFRKNIYQFPDVHDAQYVFLARSKTSYPLRGQELDNEIKQYNESKEWETLSASKGVYLFKKK